MTMAPATELRSFTDLDTARGERLDVYAEVRAPLLHLPDYVVTAFGDRYWQRTSPTPAERYNKRPAMALKEIDVRPAWRKTGTARRIHDALLVDRDEAFATLMVNPAAGEGKVHALYTSRGYQDLGFAARYYDPDISRFTSPDPSGQEQNPYL
ncbi:hypothetical protein [Streptomyces sp. IBSNAI001]|uniref:hypothetical protein n=1 Tax=Streptomyces sp. IBSNAI001 TaxID=3457499 RepID=UPI003FD5EF08